MKLRDLARELRINQGRVIKFAAQCGLGMLDPGSNLSPNEITLILTVSDKAAVNAMTGDMQIQVLGREINVNPERIIKQLADWGVKKKRSSLIPEELADKVRAYYEANRTSRKDVQIGAIARELKVISGQILKLLEGWGIRKKTYFSFINEGIANRVRTHYKIAAKPIAARPARLARPSPIPVRKVELRGYRSCEWKLENGNKCGARVREECFDRHLDRVHGYIASSAEGSLGPVDLMPAGTLSFELLPPGTWKIDDVVDYYQRASRRLHATFGGGEIEWERIAGIKSLNPTRCYVGRQNWLGYVVFEFDDWKCVILECPIKPNATYILWGDWKKMVGHTKRHLLTHYRQQCDRVCHAGNWLLKVHAVARGGHALVKSRVT